MMPANPESRDNGPSVVKPHRSAASRKRIIFICGALLIASLLVGAIEGALRLIGFGGYAPVLRVVGDTPRGRVVVSDASGAATYFFANKSKPGGIFEATFLQPKPAGVYRVLWLGESAAKGFPQPPCLAASAFLEAMLNDLWPERKVEVINLACTAVASFPIRGILKEAIHYEPDLVVVYCGNNEFFGAYGVASLHRSGDSVAAMEFQRWLRSLALSQTFERLTAQAESAGDKTLMERMMTDVNIGAGDGRRAAAARNLGENVAAMIALCNDRKVPIVVCNAPVNERDLAPLGDSEEARRAYSQGIKLNNEGRLKEAAAAFQNAVDLDVMPWRATSETNNAIRRAAQEGNAIFCDLTDAFREASPGGSVGWELMDDHVHPSLQGQDLVARSVTRSLVNVSGAIHVDAGRCAGLPDWQTYAARLGDCEYTRYAVAHTVRVINNIPFFKSTNPAALARYEKTLADLEARMSIEVLNAVREWQKPETHRGGTQRPITGMVARAMIREGRYTEAEGLSATAIRCVPPYSSWSLEFTYFMLVCRERNKGALTDSDRAIAAEAIERGRFLLSHGHVESGFTERHIGRLHQLRGEWAEAIPYLLHARDKLSGADLVAADQALVESYLRGGDKAKAERIIADGEANSTHAELYRRMRMTYFSTTRPVPSP